MFESLTVETIICVARTMSYILQDTYLKNAQTSKFGIDISNHYICTNH